MGVATMNSSDIPTNQRNSLGHSVPAHTPHAISVSLPTWKDNVGYEEGEERVMNAMVNGYPRFFIHLSIRKVRRICLLKSQFCSRCFACKLAEICEQKFGTRDEQAMLFPTARIADQCRSFMITRSEQETGNPTSVRLVAFTICPEDKAYGNGQSSSDPNSILPCANLHIILFPSSAFPIAKQFWQHTGMGISSRLAEYALTHLGTSEKKEAMRTPAKVPYRQPSKGMNRHYSNVKKGVNTSTTPPRSPTTTQPPPVSEAQDALVDEHSTYLEERYGRNLPLADAPDAKRAMRRRIAGTLVQDVALDNNAPPKAGGKNVELGPSHRGVSSVTEEDVFLYPTGMTAIWSAHAIARAVLPSAKSICFG